MHTYWGRAAQKCVLSEASNTLMPLLNAIQNFTGSSEVWLRGSGDFAYLPRALFGLYQPTASILANCNLFLEIAMPTIVHALLKSSVLDLHTDWKWLRNDVERTKSVLIDKCGAFRVDILHPAKFSAKLMLDVVRHDLCSKWLYPCGVNRTSAVV